MNRPGPDGHGGGWEQGGPGSGGSGGGWEQQGASGSNEQGWAQNGPGFDGTHADGRDWPPSGSDGWGTWNDGHGHHSPPAPGRQPAGPGKPPSPNLTSLSSLVTRQLAVPGAAVLVVFLGFAVSFVTSGGTSAINSSSDAELCSAYNAAERSWDSSSTDATEINKLGSVARRHSDADVREAGESLGDLTGMFSYGRYAAIVNPIEYRC